MLLVPGEVCAQDATWLQTPGSADFNTGANWSTATVPTGTAFFGTSNITALTLSTNTSIGGWTFSAGASPYTVVVGVGESLSFNGAGISGGSATINNNNFTGFGGSSTAGSATINNNNFTLFSFSSTAGSATINSTALTKFIGSSTAGSATINTNGGGGTSFGESSTAGSATINNNNSTGFFESSTAGSATINNHAFTGFQGSSTAGSATINNNNSLIFTDSSTAGSSTITNNSGGYTQFFQDSNGGTARLIQIGSGFVDFSWLSSTGTTAGSIEGNGNVFLGSKNLEVSGNNLSTVVSGLIQDGGLNGGIGGSLTKVGTGTLTLTNTNTYTGATVINGGTLVVDGSIVSSSLTTVNSGAALTGTGTIGNATIASGGLFMPGDGTAGSAMTVSGNLAFQPSAFYLVQTNPTTASLANVTGAAMLGGATVNAIYANGSYVARQYTILTATGGVSGAFSSLVNTNLPSGFSSGLSYDANNVYLNFALFAVPTTGLSANQQNVGRALTGFFNSTGGIPFVFGTLTPGGLTQASGEVGTGTQQTTFAAMMQFLNVLLDPVIGGRGDTTVPASGPSQFADEGDAANAYASTSRKRSGAERDAHRMVTKAVPRNNRFDPNWNIWAAGFGGSETTNGNAFSGSNTATSRVFGVAVGADYLLSPRTIAGFSLAGGGTNFSVKGFGSGRSDLLQAGVFARHKVGSAYIAGALAYGWQDVTANRTVTVAGIDQLQGRFNSNAFSGRLEGGYRFATSWIGVTPYAAGQFTTYRLPSYAEQVLSGTNTFALGYAAKNVTASRSEFGVRADKSYALTDVFLTLRSRLAWVHNFNTDRSITPTFQTLPGASFVVNGAAQAPNAALVTGSAELKWRNGVSLAATFEGEFSSATTSYAGKGVARYVW